MLKKKTSKKQEFSFKNMEETKINKKDVTAWRPKDSLMNHQKVGAALLECLIDNDTETFIEILESFLRINKLQTAKKANMSRSTVQLALSRSGNPTLKTLAKIVHESSLRKNL